MSDLDDVVLPLDGDEDGLPTIPKKDRDGMVPTGDGDDVDVEDDLDDDAADEEMLGDDGALDE